MTTITLPDSVTSVGANAFASCEKLTSISLSSKLKTIGSTAFSGCRVLQNVRIPASVTKIGDDAFFACHERMTLVGKKGSVAEKYASANKLRFREG